MPDTARQCVSSSSSSRLGATPASPPKRPAQVFIFVNPSSGGNRAAVYLQDFGPRPLGIRRSDCTADLWIYNIREGDSGEKEGFLMVKELSSAKPSDDSGEKEANEDDIIRIMVAGGDGTVMWALSELTKTEVKMDRVAVGHIPFGTGNDFSRATGWGPTARPELIGENKELLIRDVRWWLRADVKDFDVWDVDIVTAPGGQFFFVHDGKKSLKDDDRVQHGLVDLPEGGMRMRKPMVNYFSFGFLGRAGIGFEKSRTRSRLLNNLCYGWEGTKKFLFRRPPTVSDVLEDLQIGDSSPSQPLLSPEAATAPDDIKLQEAHGEEEKEEEAAQGKEEGDVQEEMPMAREATDASQASCVSSAISLNTRATGSLHFQRTTADLLFINIPSFAGGADPWAWSHGLAVEGAAGTDELLRVGQDFSDGKLEVLSYTSGLSVGLDAVNSKAWVPGRGGGFRIASDHGPFTARFLPPEKARYKDREGKVYFQIDGEFFVATKPKAAVVRHAQTVRVLTTDELVGSSGCCAMPG